MLYVLWSLYTLVYALSVIIGNVVSNDVKAKLSVIIVITGVLIINRNV